MGLGKLFSLSVTHFFFCFVCKILKIVPTSQNLCEDLKVLSICEVLIIIHNTCMVSPQKMIIMIIKKEFPLF